MKLAHIFAAIATVLMAGTLLLPYQSKLYYDYDNLFATALNVSSPLKNYIAGLELPEA